MFQNLLVHRRLTDLGDHLIELGDRVHLTIAEALGETVARLARDAVDGLLIRRTTTRPLRAHVYEPADDYDAWAESERYAEPEYIRADASGLARQLLPRPTIAALSAGLGAAGLWLRLSGSLPRALLVGLGALLLSGRGRGTDVALDLVALTGCVAAAGRSLARSNTRSDDETSRW